MSKPEDIPEDVWLDAGLAFDRLYDAEPDLEGACFQGVTEAIARAILVERAWCIAAVGDFVDPITAQDIAHAIREAR